MPPKVIRRPPPDWAAVLAELQALEDKLKSKQDTETDAEWGLRISGKPLDPWQLQVMNTKAQSLLLNCSRQVGKTEVVSIRAACRAFRYGRRVVALAPTLFQSSKVRTRAEAFLMKAGITKFVTSNATTLELPNGGAVLSLPGDRPDLSVRGETVDDLIVDEASRVKDSLIAAATPTTATKPDATITYLSTPAGKQGEFYRAWTDEKGGWERHSIPASMCSRISKTFLDRERARLGDTLFSQEYECQFVANSTSVLDPDALAAMFAQVEINPDYLGRARIAQAAKVVEEKTLWSTLKP